jgi:hypothetical protein
MATVGRLEELEVQMFMTFAPMEVEREAEDVNLPMVCELPDDISDVPLEREAQFTNDLAITIYDW